MKNLRSQKFLNIALNVTAILFFLTTNNINAKSQSWTNCNEMVLTVDDFNTTLNFENQPADCGCSSQGECTLVRIRLVETINGAETPVSTAGIGFMPPLGNDSEPNQIAKDYIDLYNPYFSQINCTEYQPNGGYDHNYLISPVAPEGQEFHVLVCPGSEDGVRNGRFYLPPGGQSQTIAAATNVTATDGAVQTDVSFETIPGKYYMAYRNSENCNDAWVKIDGNSNWPQASSTTMTIRDQQGSTYGNQYEYRVVASDFAFEPATIAAGIWSEGDLGHGGTLLQAYDPQNNCSATVSDCDDDITPPICEVSDITLSEDSLVGFVTIDFNEYISDNCDTDVDINGWNDFTQMEIEEVGQVPCGQTIQFEMYAFDDSGNEEICYINVTANCGDDPVESDTCKVEDPFSDLLWSSYLGGDGEEEVVDLFVDIETGIQYVLGFTNSTNFYSTNPIINNGNSDYNTFVLAINPDASHRWSTLITGWDDPQVIDLDPDGHLTLVGITDNPNLPGPLGLPGYDKNHNGGKDILILKMDSQGQNILYSSFYGGSGEETRNGDPATPFTFSDERLRVDFNDDRIYVFGVTTSTDLDLQNAIDTDGGDGFVFVLQADVSASSLIFSTYLNSFGTIAASDDGDFAIVFETTDDSYDNYISFNAIETEYIGFYPLPTMLIFDDSINHKYGTYIGPHRVQGESTNCANPAINGTPGFSNLQNFQLKYDGCGNLYWYSYGAGFRQPFFSSEYLLPARKYRPSLNQVSDLCEMSANNPLIKVNLIDEVDPFIEYMLFFGFGGATIASSDFDVDDSGRPHFYTQSEGFYIDNDLNVPADYQSNSDLYFVFDNDLTDAQVFYNGPSTFITDKYPAYINVFDNKAYAYGASSEVITSITSTWVDEEGNTNSNFQQDYRMGDNDGFVTVIDNHELCLCSEQDSMECQNVGLDFANNVEYVTINNVTVTNDFTVGCWVKPDLNNTYGLAQDRVISFGPSKRLEIGLVDSGGLWIYDSMNGLNESFDNIRDGNWHNIVYVAEGTTRKLYLDFELVHEYTAVTANYGDNFRIGNWMGGPSENQAFSGRVDKVMGFDIALNQFELCEAFTTSSLDQSANLQILFDFEEGIPEGDNSSLSSTINKGLLENGIMTNFDRSGVFSNFVCVEYTPEVCLDECAIDTIAPVLECSNDLLDVILQPDGTASITRDMFEVTATDNCDLVSIEGGNTNVDCDDIGKVLYMNIIVTDQAGLITMCSVGFTVLDTYGYCDDGILYTCEDSCNTDNIVFHTGVDPVSQAFLPYQSYDPTWILVSTPDPLIQVPRPAYILEPYSSWAALTHSQYISAYPDAANNDNNIANGTEYVFEKCFCVCEVDLGAGRSSSNVTIDLSAYVDNNLDIDLYDYSGNFMQNLLSIADTSTGAFMGDPESTSTTIDLESGVYCLRAKLKNDGGTAMGMSIEVNISGIGLLENSCCSTYNAVTGSVFLDNDCNGQSEDPVNNLEGWEVQLRDNIGVLLETTLTDPLGYYTFSNLEPGDYYIELAYSQDYEYNTERLLTITINSDEVVEVNFAVSNIEFCSYTQYFITYFDENCDGSLNENDSHLGGVEFNIVEQEVSDVTDSDGFIVFEGLPLGQLTAELTVPHGYVLTSTSAIFNSFTIPNNGQAIYLGFCENESLPCDSIVIENSLILNADFEILESIGNEPNDHSQLSKCKDWVQATDATSDYFSVQHYPDRVGLYNPPPPNGSDHYVGGWRIVDHSETSPEDYIEYVGACLNSPITPDLDYSINFFLGSPDATERPDTQNGLVGDFVVLGIPHCDFPIGGKDCKEDEFEVIGTISVDIANETWESHQIIINAQNEYPAIMMGMSCNTPLEDYTSNYFLLDELVVVQGNPCELDVCEPICNTKNISIELAGTESIKIITADEINNNSYDQCSDITLEIDKNSFTCADMGENVVVLTVTDGSNNSNTCQAIVTVRDTIKPICVAQDIEVFLNQNGRRTINASGIDGGSSDNCEEVSLELSKTLFTCDDIGENEVTLTATDAQGLSNTCTAIVTVSDTINPICVAQDIEIFLNQNGRRTINANSIDAGSSDNCEEVSLELSQTLFTCDDIGENEVTLTATDAQGLSSTCTTIVTISDVISPNCVAEEFSVTLNQNGIRNINISQIDGGTTDNCGEFSLELDKSTFSCEDIGENVVTLTATDSSGNTSECNAIVTVADILNPKCVTQDISITLNQNGIRNINASLLDGGTTDNCGEFTLELDKSTFTCEDIGVNVVTLFVTDGSNNSNSCTANVIVEDDRAPSCQLIDLDFEIFPNEIVTLTPEMFIKSSSSDNCGEYTSSINLTELNCSNDGENTIIITLTDANNNSVTCEATATLICKEYENILPEECESYDGSSTSNWQTIASSISIQDNGLNGSDDMYLQVNDGSGASWVYNDDNFKGDYTEFGNTCICYDYFLINDAGAAGGIVSPRFFLYSGDPNSPNLQAGFYSTIEVTTQSGWTRVCATLSSCDDNLPANDEGYWDMRIGDGCQDWNTLLSNIDGMMFYIDLTSSISEVHGYDNICIESCPLPPCSSEEITMSTGYDPVTDGLSPNNTLDPLWTLTAVPPDAGDITLPRPAYVVQGHSAWTSQTDASWVSPQPIAGYGMNNCSAKDCTCDPYTLERCFCIPSDQMVEFDLSIFCDDKVEIYLINGATGSEQLLTDNCDSSPNHFGDPLVYQESLQLSNNQYCLEARLYNTGGTAMGINILGSISSISLESDLCCNPFGKISGSIYEDRNCDGIRAQNSQVYLDPELEGVNVSLCNHDGSVVASTQSDINGIYNFVNVIPGTYNVKVETDPDWTYTVSNTNTSDVQVEVLSTQIVDFGFCLPDLCCMEDAEFDALFEDALVIESVTCGDVCVSFDIPKYDECDLLTINWGDGVKEDILGGIDPKHVYESSEDYQICLSILRRDSDGVVCNGYEECLTISIDLNDCKPCESEADFCKRVDEGYLLSLNQYEVFLSPEALSDTDEWIVDWGDGSVGNGAFNLGSQVDSHLYKQDGTYQICMIVLSKQDSVVCHEKSYCETLQIKNPNLCCIDQESFLDLVAKPFKIAVEKCGVTIKPTQPTDCMNAFISWGDGEVENVDVSIANYTHLFESISTSVNICVFYEEYNGDEFCWKHKECFEVDLDCTTESCCDESSSLITNGSFTGLPGGNISSNSSGPWERGSSSPQINNDEGCNENGSLLLWGNSYVSESTYQQGLSFVEGNTYRIAFCSRFRYHSEKVTTSGRVRLRASNSVLSSQLDCATGDCEEIFVSADIDEGWVTVCAPDWVPTQDYSILTISVSNEFSQNDGAYVSFMHVDDLCIQEIDPIIFNECCGTSEELQEAANSGVTFSSDSSSPICAVAFDDNGLLDCQQISIIKWGDGTSDEVVDGEDLPTHSYTSNGTYEICYEVIATTTDGEGICDINENCITLTYIDCTLLSTDDQSQLSIILFPNPTQDVIHLNDADNIIDLILYDTTGKKVLANREIHAQNQVTVSLSELPSGIYFIKIKLLNEQVLMEKIIKI